MRNLLIILLFSSCITINKTYVTKPQVLQNGMTYGDLVYRPCDCMQISVHPIGKIDYSLPPVDYYSEYANQFLKGEISAIEYFELLKGNEDLLRMKSLIKIDPNFSLATTDTL